MKKYASLILTTFIALAGQSALAGMMKCGSHLIEDGQLKDITREEIKEKCGSPDRAEGNH